MRAADGRQSREGYELFDHGADVGVRGFGPDRASALAQAALALTAVVTDPARVQPLEPVEICCEAADDELLLVEWLNALIWHMSTYGMLFSRFEVRLFDHRLSATAWGERIDPRRHRPAIEPKAATLTELAVRREADGRWVAQCVVDV